MPVGCNCIKNNATQSYQCINYISDVYYIQSSLQFGMKRFLHVWRVHNILIALTHPVSAHVRTHARTHTHTHVNTSTHSMHHTYYLNTKHRAHHITKYYMLHKSHCQEHPLRPFIRNTPPKSTTFYRLPICSVKKMANLRLHISMTYFLAKHVTAPLIYICLV